MLKIESISDPDLVFALLSSFGSEQQMLFGDDFLLKEYAIKITTFSTIRAIHFEGGEIAGICAVYLNRPELKVAFLSFIGLRPQFRGNGLGKILIDDCISICRADCRFERIGLEVSVANDSALRFYKSLGFSVVEINALNRIYMELIL